ncbi:MAG: hypothetical protein ACLRSW_06220 [Christensenellaceae bacterium]
MNAIAEKYDDGTVKVIDMQKAGKYFLETKRYCEISSSNVNHPNDFMHRVYAMNIMTAITDYKIIPPQRKTKNPGKVPFRFAYRKTEKTNES